MPAHKGQKCQKCQKGQKGGGSDFMHSFYSNTALGGPAASSRSIVQGLSSTPMFNPLTNTATVTGTTGIVPSGLYLASQSGGSVHNLRRECNLRGKSCKGPNGGFLHKKTLKKMLRKFK